MESLLRERHHSLEDLRLQESRFTVGFVLCVSPDCPDISLDLLTLVPSTGVFQRRLLLPPPQNEIRPVLQHASGELLLTDTCGTESKFACPAANPRSLQSICKLPGLKISVHFSL